MLGIGVLLLLAGPAYAWLGIKLSGNLALKQTAPATEILRGFDFGPVYLRQGESCRYFISATVPAAQAAPWQTSFEVLDNNRRPVFREDQIGYIGPYQFNPGRTDRVNKVFAASQASGYYYFRFSSKSAAYSANQSAVPVVEFSVRQGVLSGWPLWGPAGGLFLLGVLLIGWSLALINSLGRESNAEVGLQAQGGQLVLQGSRRSGAVQHSGRF